MKINYVFSLLALGLASVMLLESSIARAAGEKSTDANRQTFKDQIKSIRSVAGDYDVFFKEHFGPYSVPFSLPNLKQKDQTPESLLREAHKNGLTLTITVDSSTDTITGIELDESSRKPTSSNDDSDLPSELEEYKDIFKKYNSPSKN